MSFTEQGHPREQTRPHNQNGRVEMQLTRATHHPCKLASAHTTHSICNTPLPAPLPTPLCQNPNIKNTNAISRNTRGNSNPPSTFKNSRVALQHVRLGADKRLHTRNMASERCNPHGRHAIPATTRISVHAPQPFLSSPLRILPPNHYTRTSTPQHTITHEQTSNRWRVSIIPSRFYFLLSFGLLRCPSRSRRHPLPAF